MLTKLNKEKAIKNTLDLLIKKKIITTKEKEEIINDSTEEFIVT